MIGLKIAKERDAQIAAMIKQRCPTGGDEEIAHGVADTILCDILKELGFVETVKAFEAVEKWYA
jgi:hypothetical protein